MSKEFINMLYLFGAAANGKDIDIKYCENLSKIRSHALSQEVWDVVYAGVRGKVASGEINIPTEVYQRLEKTFMSNVVLNIRRVEFNLDTIRELEKNDIKCCVLKGITVANLYSMPETRISSDMDILIDEKDEKKVKEILAVRGYKTEERNKNDHHMKAYHDIGGLLEIHVALYSDTTKEIIFDDLISYDEEFTKLENGIYSLGVNDALLYLTAHLIKHLIVDGAGIRQMMDLLLYMKKYEEVIDWEKYNAIIKRLGYDNFIAVIKGIGVKYWGMNFKDAVTQGNGMEELLEDCEIGGLFSVTEKERKAFYYLYTQRRADTDNISHSLYRLSKSEIGALREIFPPLTTMKKRFSYVDKFTILLPIGWIHRIVELVLKQMGIIKEADKNLTVNQRRMRMVEKLGMLKNGEN